MKISIVEGDDRLFRAAAFGIPERDSVNRAYERLEGFARNLSSRAREKLEVARRAISSIYDEDVYDGLRRLDRSSRGLYRRNNIQFLDSQEALAQAPMEMRRWILCNPRVRTLFDSQSMDGWGSKRESFDLPDRNDVDPFWVAVNNGVAKLEKDGRYWTEYTYGTEELTGKALSAMDQMDILATFDIMNSIMDDGIDPTSHLAERL